MTYAIETPPAAGSVQQPARSVATGTVFAHRGPNYARPTGKYTARMHVFGSRGATSNALMRSGVCADVGLDAKFERRK